MTFAVGVLALAIAPGALAGTVTLYPSSFGAFTTASWRAQIGLPDTVGAADQALLLEQDTFDPGTAATAIFTGLEGERVQLLTGLEWQRRIKTDCTKTSPRWTLVVRGKKRDYVVRFGCAQSVHFAGANPNWIRDVNSQPLIRSRVMQAGGTDALAGTIVSLAIVFDDRGPTGTAILDNIRVIVKSAIGANTWTCAADNAEGVPGAPVGFAPDDLRIDPLSDSELMTLDELWPLMTADDQAIAASDTWVD